MIMVMCFKAAGPPLKTTSRYLRPIFPLRLYPLLALMLVTQLTPNLSTALAQEASTDPEIRGHLSDDIEAYGGMSAAYSGGGTSAAQQIEAIRLSPGMIGLTQKYRVAANYHWPRYGRSFYQAGVVDGTGPVKAGVLYTAPLDRTYLDPHHENSVFFSSFGERQNTVWGMRTIQKVHLTVAQTFGSLSLGVNGAYVEGMMRPYRSFQEQKHTGITFGFGGSAKHSDFRFALAAENINNQQLKDLAPTIYRAGISWLPYDGMIGIHVDYLHRQRVRSEWVLVKEKDSADDPAWESLFSQRSSLSAYERSVVGSIETQFQGVMKLVGSFRAEIGSDGFSRRSYGAGIAVAPELYEISYSIRRPDLTSTKTHQTVSLAITFEM